MNSVTPTNSTIHHAAFVLHSRPYRNTSALVDCFTPRGRVTLVARGVRTARSRYKGLLQPFMPLLLSWRGNKELVTLNHVEAAGACFFLTGRALLSGFYLNELLIRSLVHFDAYPELFCAYQKTLAALTSNNKIDVVLRLFEKTLLQELGYALQVTHDVRSGAPVVCDEYYAYRPQQGVCRVPNERLLDADGAGIFQGEHLLAIARDDYATHPIRSSAKRLLRLALQPLLGHKPLKSRALFRKPTAVEVIY